MKTTYLTYSLVLSAALVTGAAQAETTYKQTTGKQVQTNVAAAKSQKKIDKLDDNTKKMLDEYQVKVQETENLKVYNDQMEKIIASQVTEMAEMKAKIKSIAETQKGVVPLMLKMVDSLDAFVGVDIPFLTEERNKRVASLKTTLDRADVSTSEKFRRVLEAYQVENEYGRTIEAYRGTLVLSGKEQTVDYLRVGRVALMYQTLDGSESGVWSKEKKTWHILPSKYKKSINQGLRIARKQLAPNLLRLPISAPEVKS